jgi:arylsulfatase A
MGLRRLRTSAAVRAMLPLTLLATSVPALAKPVTPRGQALQSQSPNIVLILADDLGFGDVSFNGRKEYRTPNLDRIAREGTNFQRFYAGGVICGPSRASLLTGRSTIHHGVTGNDRHLAMSETTIAQALKPLGYRSAVYGKWSSGETALEHGFDDFIGYTNDLEAWEHFPAYFWFGHDKKPVNGFSADLLSDYGSAFIRRNRGNPFFLYLPFVEPHLKLEAPPADVARLRKTVKDDDPAHPYNATYAAMIERFDAAVGRVLDTLKAQGLERNTIVIVSSDNGATFESGNSGASADLDSNFPLRGGKRTVWEGGARMPTAIRWPGHIPAGRISQDVLSHLDILPTLVTAAGGTPDPALKLDGVNELAVWEGKAKPAPRTLFWEYRNESRYGVAAMSGDWKLVVENQQQMDALRSTDPMPLDKGAEIELGFGRLLAAGKPLPPMDAEARRSLLTAIGTSEAPRLYNIATDPQERRDYFFTRPAISNDLKGKLLGWLSTEVHPK